MKPRLTKHTILTTFLWLLAAGWLFICFGLSSQTGEASGRLSLALSELVSRLFRLPPESLMEVNSTLRTLAHFGCFFILSLLVGAAAATTFPGKFQALIMALLPCVAFAFIDEIRKASIPGRHCSIPEAALNAVGAVLGFVLVALCVRLRRRAGERKG